ncbi:MAG: GAF domain-containing protein, partial [Terriglobales bacterium]
DRSSLRWPDPDAQLPHGERRHAVRQKLHTPVYVSFNTPQSGAVVDLSELLDLHENGFAVQTAFPAALRNPDPNNTDLNKNDPNNTDLNKNDLNKNDRLEVNRAVTMCLDLPETRKFVHASGQVMWTDDTGRAGIRFSFLPDTSRQVLKEWLFANLLVASTNHLARTNQLAHWRQEPRAPESATAGHLAPQPKPQPIPIQTFPSAPESNALNSARAKLLSALDDIRRQIREMDAGALQGAIHPNSDARLQLIAERAASLTGASGAALALLTDGKIVCRACVGQPAPPVGSEVDARSGLSGECLRNGTVVSCADTESDRRVDPEICRMFGIGSFMAAPIFADFRVVGLVEVFSPYPHTFSQLHEIILERLAELVPDSEAERINNKTIEARTVENNNNAVVQPEAAATEQTSNPAHEPIEPELSTPRQTAAERNAILERIFEETSERPSEPPSHVRSDRLSEAASDQAAEESPTFLRRVPFSHLVLFVLTIAVAAMALGYLLAPTIEEHWPHRAEAAPPVASSSLQGAADHQAHALSTADLRKLAEQGDPDAQWQLGILYHDGDGVPKDDTLAVQWFQRAAEQGYVRAQSTLGAYYWAGRGVPQDLSKAYFWSQLALAQGDENSKSRLEGLSAQMTQAQVASARQQAEAWLRAHNPTANSKSN